MQGQGRAFLINVAIACPLIPDSVKLGLASPYLINPIGGDPGQRGEQLFPKAQRCWNKQSEPPMVAIMFVACTEIFCSPSVKLLTHTPSTERLGLHITLFIYFL